MQPEAMQPEAMAGYGQQYPVEHFVQYTPQLPHSNTSLINQAGQTEDMYSSTGGGSMAVSEPLAHYQNLRAFDSNMNQLNMSEVPQLEHDRSASLSDPEPEPERAYRWVQSSVEFPEEFPPVIRQVSDSGEGSTSSNDQQRAFSFVLEDPTQPNKICEKRPRSRSELDKQKEDIRELKKHGGACLSCYKMKKKCGPSTPCPQCKANKRQCIRKHAPSQQRPSQTPELDMSGSSIQDSDDVNELLETMQTPPSSKMSGIYCDLDDDCDFGGDLEL